VLLDELARVPRVLVLVEVDHRDVGALAREGHRHRAPDPAVAARHERDLAFELARAPPLLLAGARLGPHRSLPARLPRLRLGRP
jgi:hypothetical protein